MIIAIRLFDHLCARDEEFRKADAPMAALLKTPMEIASEEAFERGRKQGLEQRLKQGLEQSEAQSRRRVIANGRTMGLGTDFLARILDLSEDEIRAIEETMS